MMRRFVLVRNEDITGRSGVGIIGEGVAWTGGPAFLHWMTEYESFVQWPGGVDAILAVHGHEGATIVRWLDVPTSDETPPYEPKEYGLIPANWEDLLAGQTYPPPSPDDYPDNDPYDPRD